MGFWRDNFLRKQTSFEVIGGRNYFKKSLGNVYHMIQIKEKGEGVVKIKGKLYYFLGAFKEEKYKRSAGKAATGAIVGGLLTGGVGAIAGAAIGGRKKDNSTFWMDFVDYETKQEFSVQVKQGSGQFSQISNFKVANPIDIGLEK
ncbi:hypothetical protein GCM10011391_27990 [Pullulanibacillus camelliae]|uniref:Uncharacterized protein n=1 Tax=Pullulanibacillus camelliae TaxID=1707096 RepID=A0A8J2YJB0_9BACL|nr:hypothetical protein [Pullulanibacillus camelliae]GGE47608.1 hypothetical protein GCM10011391_27990 [Pullulanibacillus camelliae]